MHPVAVVAGAVEDDEVRGPLLQGGEQVTPILDRDHLIAMLLEQPADRLPVIRVLITDEDALASHPRGAPAIRPTRCCRHSARQRWDPPVAPVPPAEPRW